MACPLSALVEARFTDFTGEGKDYPDVSVLEKKFVSYGRPLLLVLFPKRARARLSLDTKLNVSLGGDI